MSQPPLGQEADPAQGGGMPYAEGLGDATDTGSVLAADAVIAEQGLPSQPPLPTHADLRVGGQVDPSAAPLSRQESITTDPRRQQTGRTAVAAATASEQTAPAPRGVSRRKFLIGSLLAGGAVLAVGVPEVAIALSHHGNDSGTDDTAPPAPQGNTQPSPSLEASSKYSSYPLDYNNPPGTLSAFGGSIPREWGRGNNGTKTDSVDWNGTEFRLTPLRLPVDGNPASYKQFTTALWQRLAAYMSIDPSKNPQGYGALVQSLVGGSLLVKNNLEGEREAFTHLFPTAPAGSVLFMPWDDQVKPALFAFSGTAARGKIQYDLDSGPLYVRGLGWQENWAHDTYLGYDPGKSLLVGAFDLNWHTGAGGIAVPDNLNLKLVDRVSRIEITK